MKDFLAYRDEAVRKMRLADHMLTMTYPLLKDPKILLSVLQNIFSALSNAVSAVLYQELYYKRIPHFNDSFESRFNALKAHVVKKYNIDLKTVRLIAELRELLNEHERASVEFSRKGKLFMARDDYIMRSLSPEDLKRYLKKGKEATHDLLRLVIVK